MNVLIIAEHNNQQLSHTTRHAITAGVALGDVSVLVAGSNCDSVVREIAKVKGVMHVLHADAEHYKHQLPEELTPLIVSIKDRFDYFIASASVFGKNIMPRVAAILDVSQISDVMKIIDSHTF